MIELQEGRRRMRQACIDAALANTPDSLRVIHIRRTLSGRAYSAQKIAVPRPFTRRALHVFLHECAHVALGHVGSSSPGRGGPRHREEYEAEQWAFERMRAAGIPVPRKALRRAKGYVAYKIRQALRRGAKNIDKTALRWAGEVGA